MIGWVVGLRGLRARGRGRVAAPPNRDWTNDNGALHRLGRVAVHDDGLGLSGITLSGAASGNQTLGRACGGDPYRDGCDADFATDAFAYTLREGVNTLTLTARDIVDNAAAQTWTQKIDRTPPAAASDVQGSVTEDGQAAVTWTAADPPAANGTAGSGIANYTIRHRPAGGAWSAPVALADPRLSIDGAVVGHTLEVEITASDNAGNTGPPARAQLTLAAESRGPGAYECIPIVDEAPEPELEPTPGADDDSDLEPQPQVCPPGQEPWGLPFTAPKSIADAPELTPDGWVSPPEQSARQPDELRASPGGFNHFYAGYGRQYGGKYQGGEDAPGSPTRGARAALTVHAPAVQKEKGAQSLAEIAVSRDRRPTFDAIEVGWVITRIDTTELQASSTKPRLFVFHWIGGDDKGYNTRACRPFGAPSRRTRPGAALTTTGVTSGRTFAIVHDDAQQRWEITYRGRPVCALADSLWGGDSPRFTRAQNLQWFGEVSDEDKTPCSSMGNGPARMPRAARRASATCATSAAHPTSTTSVIARPGVTTTTPSSSTTATASSTEAPVAARQLVAAALLALAATSALVPGTAAQEGLRVATGDAEDSPPSNTRIVTMHATVQTASFAAAWFEYRGYDPRTGRMRYVTRTDPIVVAEGTHELTQKSRTVVQQAPYDYRVVARTIDATVRGEWRHRSHLPHGGPPPLPPPPKPPG